MKQTESLKGRVGTAGRALLLGSAAGVTLSMFMAVGVANAQSASVALSLDTTSVAIADLDSVLDQDNSAPVAATASGAALSIVERNSSGAITMSSVTGVLADNLVSASATGNTSDSSVQLNVSPTLADDTVAVATGQYSNGSVSALVEDNVHGVVISGVSGGSATLTGTLAVTNNDMTATATMNNADASITVAGGVSLAGTDSGASVATDATAVANPDLVGSADLVIATVQQADAPTSATIDGWDVNATVDVLIETVSGSTVTVSGSDLAASATGNTLTANLDATDTTTNEVGASVAMAGFQSLDGNVSATVLNGDIDLSVGWYEDGNSANGVTASTLTLDSNTVTASATGNSSDQGVSLTANSLVGDVATAGLSDSSTAASGGIQLLATADAVVTNVQVQDAAASVTALVNETDIGTDVYNIGSESTVNVTANRLAAQAVGAVASTDLTLSANAIDATGAVASVQANDGDVTATVQYSSIGSWLSVDQNHSSVHVDGNRITALAAGVQAASSLTIADGTNNLSIAGNSGGVTTVALATPTETMQPTVNAAYALSNDQSSTGDVSAENLWNDISFVGDDDSWTSVTSLDNNVLSAAANAQTASNAVSLSFNNLTGTATTETGSTTVLAAAANAQTFAGGSVSAVTYDGNPLHLSYDDEAPDSSISTSSNIVSASVIGNRTLENSVTVDPTNLVMASNSQVGSISSVEGVEQSAHLIVTSLQEVQDATLTASQNSGGSSNLISTDVSNWELYNSSVVSDSNLMTVSVTANSAVNDMAVGSAATAEVTASSALVNAQIVDATNLTAELGIEGTEATPAYTSSNGTSQITGLTMTSDGNSQYTNTGGTAISLTFNSTLTSEEQALLTAAGFTNVTATSAEIAAGAQIDTTGRISVTFGEGANPVQGSGDETFQIGSFVAPAVDFTPNGAGVTVFSDDLVASTVSVSDNTLASTILGNQAVNTLAAEATTLGTVQANVAGADITAGTPSTAVVTADHALLNEQIAVDSTATSTVYGTFAIDINDNNGASGSTVLVDGNTIEASATANSATNAVNLTATNADTTAGLASTQDNFTDVITTADMMVYTSAASIDSTVSMSDNVNQSLATGNSASNSVAMAATNVGSVSGDDAYYDGAATADLTLMSYQNSEFAPGIGSGVSAVADTTIFNGDMLDTDVGPIETSTFAMDGNVTVAQATSNTVANVMSVGSADTANTNASAFLGNAQDSTQFVTATSTASQELTLESISDTILNSTVSVDGNVTTARATANSSTNQMSVAGANIAAGSGNDAYANLDFWEFDAAYVVANEQYSNSAINATASATNSVDLTSSDNALDASTVSLNGNVVQAYATANMASNSVLNVGGSATANLNATGLLYNEQYNEGPTVEAYATSVVTATADAVDAATVGAALNGSSLSIENNVSVALARGNVASNSMNVSAVNATVGNGAAAINDSLDVVSASYAVINDQSNYTSITAVNDGSTYGAALNGGLFYDSETAMLGSSLSVTGNVVQAAGYGNIATNSLTLTSLNSVDNDATAAVYSTQYNGGSVTSTVSNASIGHTSLGALTTGTVSVGGNTVSASAVGNLATSTITRN